MNFYFQTGEFLNKTSPIWISLLGYILGPVIGALVALLVFKLNVNNDKKKNVVELKTYGELIKDFLSNILINIEQSILSYNDCIKEIESYPYKDSNLGIVLNPILHRLKSFDDKTFIKVFKELRIENKHLVNLILHVEFLYSATESITEGYFKNSLNYITPLSNDFIKNRNEILNECGDYIDECKKNNKTDHPLYGFINSLMVDYITNAGTYPDILYDMNSLINPLKFTLIEKFRFEHLSNITLKKTKTAGDLYETISQLNLAFANDIKTQMEFIIKAQSDLKEINTILIKKFSAYEPSAEQCGRFPEAGIHQT